MSEGVEADIGCACVEQREADCRLKAGEQNDAMNAYHNAAKSYKKSDPEGASQLQTAQSALPAQTSSR